MIRGCDQQGNEIWVERDILPLTLKQFTDMLEGRDTSTYSISDFERAVDISSFPLHDECIQQAN